MISTHERLRQPRPIGIYTYRRHALIIVIVPSSEAATDSKYACSYVQWLEFETEPRRGGDPKVAVKVGAEEHG